jgi:hypothetical protein
MDWIDVAQDRGQWWALLNTLMNYRVPRNAVKLCICIPCRLSRRAQHYADGSADISPHL